MSDEKNNILNAEDSDPKEAEALQEMLNKPVGQADSSVFEENLFGSPPPAPDPQPQPQDQPQPVVPEPVTETAPPPATQGDDDDVKIVTPEDFARMTSSPEPPSDESAQGFSVNGFSAGNVSGDDEWGKEDLPDIAATAVEPATEPQPPPAGESTDEWELENPVDENASLDDAISREVAKEDEEDEIPMEAEDTPIALKAAKAKEGAEAVAETRELIEKLDGEEKGFLDAEEIRQGLHLIAELAKRIDELTARIEALEERLK